MYSWMECLNSIDGNTIEKVNKMKYLGVFIDDKLSFKDHLEFITKKISKKVYFMSKVRNKLDKETKIVLYKSIIVPHIIIQVQLSFWQIMSN